jgi:hypothetical protein
MPSSSPGCTVSPDPSPGSNDADGKSGGEDQVDHSEEHDPAKRQEDPEETGSDVKETTEVTKDPKLEELGDYSSPVSTSTNEVNNEELQELTVAIRPQSTNVQKYSPSTNSTPSAVVIASSKNPFSHPTKYWKFLPKWRQTAVDMDSFIKQAQAYGAHHNEGFPLRPSHALGMATFLDWQSQSRNKYSMYQIAVLDRNTGKYWPLRKSLVGKPLNSLCKSTGLCPTSLMNFHSPPPTTEQVHLLSFANDAARATVAFSIYVWDSGTKSLVPMEGMLCNPQLRSRAGLCIQSRWRCWHCMEFVCNCNRPFLPEVRSYEEFLSGADFDSVYLGLLWPSDVRIYHEEVSRGGGRASEPQFAF